MKECVHISVLITVVVLVRALMGDKGPKRTFVILWLITALRILLPVSIPSPVSLYRFINIYTSSTSWSAEATGGIVKLTENSTASPAGMLVYIRYAGIAVCALYFILSHARGRYVSQWSLPVEDVRVTAWKSAHPLRRGYRVKQCDMILSPYTGGVFSPVIYLPKSFTAWDTEKLYYVLAHEYAHIRYFDVAAKWGLAAALCVQWFNPLAWLMYGLAGCDMERACDEAALRLTASNRSAYALALLLLEESHSHTKALYGYFARTAVEVRIRSIMKTRPCSPWAVGAAGAVVLAVTAVFATTPPVLPAPGVMSAITMVTVIVNETETENAPAAAEVSADMKETEPQVLTVSEAPAVAYSADAHTADAPATLTETVYYVYSQASDSIIDTTRLKTVDTQAVSISESTDWVEIPYSLLVRSGKDLTKWLEKTYITSSDWLQTNKSSSQSDDTSPDWLQMNKSSSQSDDTISDAIAAEPIS